MQKKLSGHEERKKLSLSASLRSRKSLYNLPVVDVLVSASSFFSVLLAFFFSLQSSLPSVSYSSFHPFLSLSLSRPYSHTSNTKPFVCVCCLPVFYLEMNDCKKNSFIDRSKGKKHCSFSFSLERGFFSRLCLMLR